MSNKNKSQTSLDALFALQQEFPDGTPDVRILSKEQKAWLHIQMQSLSCGMRQLNVYARLKKMCGRLLHATEDIPDEELQKMASFIFENINEIQKALKEDQDLS